MIVDLHKYLIYGGRDEMNQFFELAQRAGFLEFIGSSHKKVLELPEEAKTLLFAIKLAKQHFIHPKEAPLVPHNPLELAQLLISLNQENERLSEEKRVLRSEIARIAVFGDFSKEALQELADETRRTFQFFCMKSDLAREMTLPNELIFVGTEYDLDYFIAIQKEPKQYPKMVEIHIERPVGELRKRLIYVNKRLKEVETDLRTYANALPLLQEGLVAFLNEHHLKLSKLSASLELNETFFACEAWVPTTRIKALQALLRGLGVQAEEIAIEERDRIPTCMENRGWGKVGEDLIQIYDIPAHTDKDPSRWVLIFFALFFAMIISDAGYGLVYLLIALFFRWKLSPLKGSSKRFMKLFVICSSACIVWGVATASYFGLEIGPDNPLRKTSFLHYLARKKAEYHMERQDRTYQDYIREFPAAASAQNGHDFLVKVVKREGHFQKHQALDDFYDSFLMEFAFLVGMAHISLSFLRNLLNNWAGLGWVLFIFGGYLYFPPTTLHAVTLVNVLGWIDVALAEQIGLYMTLGGIGFAFVAALIQKLWGAFHELLNIVQVFADVLSYLRLYALALGGMVMAHTFNDRLGIDFNPLVSFFVILVGHLINIGLCAMGGVIHGLRLNFIEWYHYSFEGGGRIFNPLRIRR